MLRSEHSTTKTSVDFICPVNYSPSAITSQQTCICLNNFRFEWFAVLMIGTFDKLIALHWRENQAPSWSEIYILICGAQKSTSDSDSRSTGENEDSDDTKQNQGIVLQSFGQQSRRPLFPAGTVAPVSCDVYCSACAVSFNSTTQARQHYHGKSHAKRLRTILAELSSTSGCNAPHLTPAGTAIQ